MNFISWKSTICSCAAAPPMAAIADLNWRAPRRIVRLGEFATGSLADFDSVWMRKDPPFDMKFFFATHLLSLIDEKKCFVMNNPKGLREANEKLYAMRFPEQIPQTLVSSNMEGCARSWMNWAAS